jgi:hypothetical protein
MRIEHLSGQRLRVRMALGPDAFMRLAIDGGHTGIVVDC